MSPWVRDLFTTGWRHLLRHKLRSGLTLLGVFFGVAAVITMLGVGEGAQRSVLREISGLGLDNILIDSVRPDATEVEEQRGGSTRRRGIRILEYGITEADVAQLREACPEVQIRVAHRVKETPYVRGHRLDAEVLGVPPDYFDLFDSRLVQGRWLHPLDNDNLRSVMVAPAALRNRIVHPQSGTGDPRVNLGTRPFDVVGLVETMAPGGDRTLYIPYTTAEDIFGISSARREAGTLEFTRTPIGQVVINCPDEASLRRTAEVVKRTFSRNHELADYRLTIPVEILEARQRTQRILNLVLLVIAGISLLVGGIGIMNIMLAVVTERIPEIGIRRAIGATRRDILLQFLAETVTLSTLGGILGCIAGIIAVPLTEIWTGWNGVVTPGSVLVSLAVSWVVGVFFGLAPAIRASNLDPVEALRQG